MCPKPKPYSVLWDCRCLLVKPQTYMNDSGVAVSRLAQYYKVCGL